MELEVFAYSRIFPRRFGMHVPYSEIIKAVVKRHRRGGRVRLLRTASPSGDVSIVTVNDSFLKIVDLLQGKGVQVTDE